MKVKNLTNEYQTLQLKELGRGSTIYEVSIIPHGITDIERTMSITNLNELSNSIEIVSETRTSPVQTNDEEYVLDSTPVFENTEEPEVAIVDDKIICDICGAEFASERGLASHKNRAHSVK